MTARGSPSAILRPKFSTTRRSTTASSACTTCSIQTMVTPRPLDVADGGDERGAFSLGQAAGDLVEQQQARLAWQERAPARAACARAASASRRDGWRAPRGRCARRISAQASTASRSRRPLAVDRGDQQVLEHASGCRRAAGSGSERAMPARQRRCCRVAVTSRPSRRTRAGVRPERAGDQVEQRRLAGPVRADDAERLAFGYREVEYGRPP